MDRPHRAGKGRRGIAILLRRLFRRVRLARRRIYQLSDDERAGIERGLEDMRAGRFATADEIDAIFLKVRSFRA
jgi:predicted transcriptional regulator